MINWILGIPLAVGLSNAIVLLIYYSGHPMLALGLSGPVGLVVGMGIGVIIARRNARLTTGREEA